MTWIVDLSEYTHDPSGQDSPLLAVGWLERGNAFSIGPVDRAVYERLTELFRDPWQPAVSMGHHECDLCAFTAEARGSANLIVPGQAKLYICPELILHYINAHGYHPPEEFCEAVLNCPDTRSMEYKRMLLAAGGRSLVKKQG